jgi:hypothetical protein
LEQVQALLYRAELAVRLGEKSTATTSLAEARSIELTDDEQATAADDMALTAELVRGLD